MALFGASLWDRVGGLGQPSAQRVGLLLWHGDVPPAPIGGGTTYVYITDVDGLPQAWGVWDTVNGGHFENVPTVVTISYDAGTRTITLANTGGPVGNVYMMKW